MCTPWLRSTLLQRHTAQNKLQKMSLGNQHRRKTQDEISNHAIEPDPSALKAMTT